MTDVNKTTHIGTATTNPTLLTLGSGTTMAFFTLRVKESWITKDKRKKHRYNFFKFEAMGAKAHWVKANVKAGRRYYIDGTDRHEVREDEVDHFSKRILHIEDVTSDEYEEGRLIGNKEALKKGLAIVESSDDLKVAKAKLEVLISEL
jgi:single-stranded DNA-binding protein